MIVGPKQPSRGRDAGWTTRRKGLLPERGYAAMGALLRREHLDDAYGEEEPEADDVGGEAG